MEKHVAAGILLLCPALAFSQAAKPSKSPRAAEISALSTGLGGKLNDARSVEGIKVASIIAETTWATGTKSIKSQRAGGSQTNVLAFPILSPSSAAFSGNISQMSVVPAGGVSRTLSSLNSDMLNLKSLGAACDGSAGDYTTIQKIYAAQANGATIAVPNGCLWSGTIRTPSATKALNWNFLGTNNAVSFGVTRVGDGDLAEFHVNGGIDFQKRSVHAASSAFNFPVTMGFYNEDANYAALGADQQLTALTVNGFSGPTAGGSTGAAQLNVSSYGMTGYGSDDIPLNISVYKYGQNATWGSVVQNNDLSGRLPGAFAGWVTEMDGVGNGHDLSPMDPSFYTPQVGKRVIVNGVIKSYPEPVWTASHAVVAKGEANNSFIPATVIKVTGPDRVLYTWYCTTSGTTGTIQPRWPAPAVFTASIANGTMTVTRMQSGSPTIAVNQQIFSNSLPVTAAPVAIKAQLTGSKGGVGTYATSLAANSGNAGAAGFYAARSVSDGTVVWSFGSDYSYGMQSAFFVTANSPDAYVRDAFGANVSVNGAVFDASAAVLDRNGAAALRLAANQPIDFSYSNSAASENYRKMIYTTHLGANYLGYFVSGKGAIFQAYDSGAFKTLRNTLDDGHGNQTLAAKTINAGIQINSGSATIGSTVNTFVENGTGVDTITMPAAPSNASDTLQELDVIFAVAPSSVSWVLGSGRQSFTGSRLPSSVPTGAIVRFIWNQNAATWLHLINY